jgi:hypothetical protein
MKGPGITINSRGLIAGRPDMRGLYHESVQQYLDRGGIIRRVSSAEVESRPHRKPGFIIINNRAQTRKGGV